MSNRNWGFRIRGEDDGETVEIDIYDVIGESWWSDGVTAKDVRDKLKSASNAKLIRLRVNSGGGDVFDGFAIYNLLAQHPARVEADVDALAASMASVVIMAADEIRVASNAMVMIHNPWALAMGDADAMLSMAELLNKIRGQIADAYVARTKASRDEVLELMDAETWMTAEEALERGFADAVRPAKARAQAYARLNLAGFDAVPARLRRLVAQAREGRQPPPEPPAPAPASTNDPTAVSGGVHTPKEQRMADLDLKTLRAQHPDVYDAAVQDGVQQERKRVQAHLKLAETFDAMDVAKKAIASGASTMEEDVHADYLSAGRNKQDREVRQQETDDAGEIVRGAKPEPEQPKDLVDRAAEAFERRRKGVSDE